MSSGPVPLHVPGSAVSVSPTSSSPEIAGAAVLAVGVAALPLVLEGHGLGAGPRARVGGQNLAEHDLARDVRRDRVLGRRGDDGRARGGGRGGLAAGVYRGDDDRDRVADVVAGRGVGLARGAVDVLAVRAV